VTCRGGCSSEVYAHARVRPEREEAGAVLDDVGVWGLAPYCKATSSFWQAASAGTGTRTGPKDSPVNNMILTFDRSKDSKEDCQI
jgi:hypothetical protein